jgi:hypothetical protein
MKNSFIIQNPISMSFLNVTDDIKLLTFINDFVPKASEARLRRYRNKLVKAFNVKYPEEKEGFSKLMQFFTEAEKSKISGGRDLIRFNAEGEKVGEALRFMIDFHNLTVKAPEFIKEMSIVYLVTSFEDFLASVLKSHFLNRPKSLNSNKQMTNAEILSCKNLNELTKRIIDKELSDVFYASIDGINNYLKNKFRFRLDKQKEWREFREVFYRRNIIIHNDGFPNDEYNSKTGHKGVEKLKIDNDYLAKSFEVFFFYSKLVAKKFYDKKLDKKVPAKEIE